MVAADAPPAKAPPPPLTRTSIDPPALSCPLASPTARACAPPAGGGDAFAAFQPWLAAALGVGEGASAAAAALAALDGPRLAPGASPSIAVYGCADAPADAAGRAAGLAELVAAAGLLGGGGGGGGGGGPAAAPAVKPAPAAPPAPALLAVYVDGPGALDWGALATSAAAAAAAATGSRAWCPGAACPPVVPALVPRALHAGAAAPAAPPGTVVAGVLAGGDGLVRLAAGPTADDAVAPASDGAPSSSPPPPPFCPFWCRDSSPTPHPAWARRARADAVTFLRARAVEVAPGGLLLIVTPGAMGAACAGAGALDAVRDAAAAGAAEGSVDPHLLAGFRAPLYFYEARDLEAAAGACGGDWAVLQRGAVTLPSLLDDWRAGSLSDAQYGAAVAAAGRALVGAPLRAALGLDDAGADALFARAAGLVAANPGRYPVRNCQAAVLLRRRGGGSAGGGGGGVARAAAGAAAPGALHPPRPAASRWAGRLWPPVADAWASRRRSTDI